MGIVSVRKVSVKLNEALDKLHQYKCFFCGENAILIGYYTKLYNLHTRENPTFFCNQCWNDPLKRDQINGNRGGMDGVFCITFKGLGKMSSKQMGMFLGEKNYEINHCANPTWRKMIWQIHFLSIPPRVSNENT